MLTGKEESCEMADQFYNGYQQRIYHKIDRCHFWLLLSEFAVIVLCSYFIGPAKWNGSPEVWRSYVAKVFLLQLVVVGLPVYLILTLPGRYITRHVIAIAQMFTSALLIHVTHGSIESHFHVFGALALLATYRSSSIIVLATIVVACDHLFRGIYLPESVFGSSQVNPYLWLYHIIWIVFADIFLIWAIKLSHGEMREIARNDAQLKRTNEYISEQVKQKSAELERQSMELVQAQKLESIGQLAAGIAHEINTPAQYIGDNVYFLKDTYKDLLALLNRYQKMARDLSALKKDSVVEEVEALEENCRQVDLDFLLTETPAAIDQALEGIDRVTKIVQAMKDFSHPSNGVKEYTDLNRAIRSTAVVARNEWRYAADLEMNLEENLPAVYCYPDALNQVVLNLVVNSAHSIQEMVDEGAQKGLITICTKTCGDQVEITIADSGKGIDEKIQSQIFDPFFTTKEVGKGTGQGLHIAHNIVTQSHGGQISFKSEKDKGTTFTIRIPIEASQDESVSELRVG